MDAITFSLYAIALHSLFMAHELCAAIRHSSRALLELGLNVLGFADVRVLL